MDFQENQFLMFVIDDLANQMEEKGDGVIRMTLGNSDLPLNQNIIDEMIRGYQDYDKYSLVYPAGLPELRQALVEHYQANYQAEIDKDNIIISVGSSNLFRNLYQIILDRAEDEVLLPLPYYPLYKICADILGRKVSYYRINKKDMRVDMKSFYKNLNTRTKIIVINSPGNPLGNIVSYQELENITQAARENGSYVIFDEIYNNVVFDGELPEVYKLNGAISSQDITNNKWIVTNSFSKGYRMYSRRVGWGVVPDELVTPLTTIQHHTLLTVDPIVQFAGIEALKYPEEVEYIKRLYIERRDYTLEKMSGLDQVSVLYSSGGFYISLDCRKYMEAGGFSNELELAKEILEYTKVAVVPGSDFGAPGTLRLSFTCPEYKNGIDELYNYFS